MPNFIDLSGQKFGKLTVVRQVTNSKCGKIRWLCRCRCGKFSIVISNHLRNGNSTTCGCGWITGRNAANARKFVDLTGRIFGRLTVTAKAFTRSKQWHWTCRCECGAEMVINGKSLKRGLTKSCGCLQKEIASRTSKIVAAGRPRVGGRFVKITEQ